MVLICTPLYPYYEFTIYKALIEKTLFKSCKQYWGCMVWNQSVWHSTQPFKICNSPRIGQFAMKLGWPVFIHEAGPVTLGVSVLKNLSVLFLTHTHTRTRARDLACWLVAQISCNCAGNDIAPFTEVPVLDCCQYSG